MKRKMRALFLTLLTLVCAVFLAVAVACDNGSVGKQPEPGKTEPGNTEPGNNPGNEPGEEEPETPPEEKETYTVSFDMNGHGVAIAARSAKEGEKVEEPAEPKALYMTFGGWFEDAECDKKFDFSEPLTANVTVYASWIVADNMPSRGYTAEKPRMLTLNDADVSAVYIASGTTLYYAYDVEADGRYCIALSSFTGAHAKCEFTYSVTDSTETELDAISSDGSVWLTLKEGQRFTAEITVKENEFIDVEAKIASQPSVYLAIGESTDEPVPEGMFLEGLYTGVFKETIDVYFRIVDRTAKTFTFAINAEGTTKGKFKYLNGKVIIEQATDWGFGFGEMTWTAPDGEDEPATITFVGAKNPNVGTSAGTLKFTQYIEPISLDHSNWVGEYKTDSADAEFDTVRIGERFVQFVNGSTVETYFTDNDTAVFTNTEISFGSGKGTVTIKTQANGYVESIRLVVDEVKTFYTLNSKTVNEVPAALPLVAGASYEGTVENTTYSFTTSDGVTKVTGFGSSAVVFGVLDFDGETYSGKVTVGTDTRYFEVKIVHFANSKVIEKVEVYENGELFVTLVTDAIDVSDNVYDLAAGPNSGTVNVQTGYAYYYTADEKQSYTFTGDVVVYSGVNMLKPNDTSAWTQLPNGEAVEMAGTVLAVKDANGGSSVTFSVDVKPIAGISQENPVVTSESYTFPYAIVKGEYYYLTFVAPEKGTYTFTTNRGKYDSYTGFCINDQWYKYNATGSSVNVSASCTMNLEAGDEVAVCLLSNTSYYDSVLSVVFAVTASLDLVTGATDITAETGTIASSGKYYTTLATSGKFESYTFTSSEQFTVLLANGTSSKGTSVTVTVTDLRKGIKITGENVSYKGNWNTGYEQNPGVLAMGASAAVSYIEPQGSGRWFTYTAPRTMLYTFTLSVNAAQIVVDGEAQGSSYTVTLQKGATIKFAVTHPSATSGTFRVTTAYNFAADVQDTAFAASGTLQNGVVYRNTNAEANTLKITAPKTFTVIYSTTATGSGSTQSVTKAADGSYTCTLTLSGRYFFVDFGENETVSCEIASYVAGTSHNPFGITLGEKTLAYTSAYTDGYYYFAVTVSALGEYQILVNTEGYEIAGNNINGEGIVTFSENTQTFTIRSTEYGAGGETVTGSVALSLMKHVATQTLTFNEAEGREGNGLLTLASGSAYTVGDVVTTESNDKYVASIRFSSSSAFSFVYFDDSTATATRNTVTGDYEITATVANVRKGFTLTAEGNVYYAVNWTQGSMFNPFMFEDYTAGTTVSFKLENVAYLYVTNISPFNWNVSVSTANYTLEIVGNRGGRSGSTNSVTVGEGENVIVTVTNNASNATSVSAKISIVNDFSDATQLEFDADYGEKTIAPGFAGVNYTVGTLDADVEKIVFTSTGTNNVYVALTDGTEYSGTTVQITVAEAQNGFNVGCSDEVKYTVAWYSASSKNPLVLKTGSNSIAYRKGATAYAEFTATTAGYHLFSLGATGYIFSVNGEGEYSGRVEVYLAVGDKVAIVLKAASESAASATVSMTLSVSATKVIPEIPAGMLGTWTFDGTVVDSWAWNSSMSAVIKVKNDATVTYTFSVWSTVTSEVALSLAADGSYTGQYTNGSNKYTLTLRFTNNVLYFTDSYNATGSYAMTKQEESGGDGFSASQQGTYVLGSSEFKIGTAWHYATITVVVHEGNTITYSVVGINVGSIKDEGTVFVDSVTIEMSQTASGYEGTYDGGSVSIAFSGGNLTIKDAVYTYGSPYSAQKQ